MGINELRALLFSGGLDSTALAGWQRPDRLVFVDYGQISADGERRAADQIADVLGLPLLRVSADCRSLGIGHLAGKASDPRATPEFWPYRNQLLLTLAGMALYGERPLALQLGTVSDDEAHPDGRTEFLRHISQVFGSQDEVLVEAPAKHLSSLELLLRAQLPMSTLGWTFSCHRSAYACGQCRGCTKHFRTLSAYEAERA